MKPVSFCLSFSLVLSFVASHNLSAKNAFVPCPLTQSGEKAVQLRSFDGKSFALREWAYSAKEGFRGKVGTKPVKLDPGKAWILSMGGDEGDAGGPGLEESGLPTNGFLQLRSGAILEGTCLGGGENSFRFRIRHGNEVEVPLTYVQGFRRSAVGPIVTLPGKEGAKKKHQPRDANFGRALRRPPLESDLCFYTKGRDKNGNPTIRRIPCKVLGGTRAKGKAPSLLLQVGGSERSLPLSKVYGVVFAEGSGIEAVAPKGVPVDRAKLPNGTVLLGRLLSASSTGPWVFQTLEGFTLRMDQGGVEEVEFGSTHVQFVSMMPGVQIAQTPTLDRKWPTLRDHSPAGKVLKLGVRKFRHGFWAVPNLRMEIPLAKRSGRLLGKVGLVSRGKGLITLRILGDGKPLLKGLELKAGDQPRTLSYAFKGVERIVLELNGSFMLDSGAAVILGDLRILEQ